MHNFFIYLAVMAAVTYIVRMLPFVLIKRKLENRFLISFLYYMPYAVLTVMTFPAILSSTGNTLSSLAGLAVGLLLSYFERSLVFVAVASCCAAFITNMFI